MKKWLPILAVVAGLGSSISPLLFAQLVSSGPPDPQMRWCRDERVAPNLRIAKPVSFSGSLSDASGAPIRFEKTIVQIRDFDTERVLFSAELDDKGKFDFRAVPAGAFRLVAALLTDGNIRRLPLMDQPKNLTCTTETECRVQIMLQMHGTDTPYEACPPK